MATPTRYTHLTDEALRYRDAQDPDVLEQRELYCDLRDNYSGFIDLDSLVLTKAKEYLDKNVASHTFDFRSFNSLLSHLPIGQLNLLDRHVSELFAAEKGKTITLIKNQTYAAEMALASRRVRAQCGVGGGLLSYWNLRANKLLTPKSGGLQIEIAASITAVFFLGGLHLQPQSLVYFLAS